ncbi:ankyrin repeat-containing domain protein [Xylariales sp. PMI_506]|nr:ankyrin repeat-containing domain protein [Xylariales sp. PMI_506]
MSSTRAQLQQQAIMAARQRQLQAMTATRLTAASGSSSHGSHMQPQPQPLAMGSTYDDLPIREAGDLDFRGPNPTDAPPAFENACQHGPLSTVESLVTSEARTPAFLHHGLTLALRAGNVSVARYLLSAGAPIVRKTPDNILSAPRDTQIPLFELLTEHGWTPNTPGYYGAVLLPNVVAATNMPLLSWFLTHGADPNLGPQRDYRDRTGGSETNSCVALETAASRGDEEAVRMLLDAGARIENGSPLHCAAGACPPGSSPQAGPVSPSREFDTSRIPTMGLLVERGADVNQRQESRHMVLGYAIVHAVKAGAVERVKWLLEQGANPEVRGAWGSAVEFANVQGSDGMKQVLTEGVKARRWE